MIVLDQPIVNVYMQVKEKIAKRERNAIRKLKHGTCYKYALATMVFLFSPSVKKFIFLPFKGTRKVFGVISLSIYKFFGYRFWYVDDFIVHKKLRWKWYGKQLFERTIQEAEKQKSDYVVLFSRDDRKGSHKFYKKSWLTIISLGIAIFAYKKINKKK